MKKRAMDSLESIYGNCQGSPDDDCRLWRGAMANRYPVSTMRDDSKASGQRQVHVRRRVWELAKGQPAPAGPRYVLIATCGHDRCVSEKCLKLVTKAQRLRQAAARGAYSSPAFRAKVAAAKRAGSKLSDAGVAELQAGLEPVRVIAQRLNLSVGYAYAVQRGEHRRDYSGPFAALVPRI